MTKAKVKKLDEIITYCKEKKERGDSYLLADFLGISVDAARQRLVRREEKIYKIYYLLTTEREKFKESLSEKIKKQIELCNK